jgi:hypothetical protein
MKERTSLLTTTVSGLLSGIASTYFYAISPLYASRDRLLTANLTSLVCMSPMVISLLLTLQHATNAYVFESIMFSAMLQIFARVWFNLAGIRHK